MISEGGPRCRLTSRSVLCSQAPEAALRVVVENDEFNHAHPLFSRQISQATTSRSDVADAAAAMGHPARLVVLMQSLSWLQSLSCPFSLSFSLQRLTSLIRFLNSVQVSGIWACQLTPLVPGCHQPLKLLPSLHLKLSHKQRYSQQADELWPALPWLCGMAKLQFF